MFGIGLSKKVDRLDACLYTLGEQRMRDLSSIHADMDFIVQELAKMKLENAALKKQLLKEKGRVVLTIYSKELK